MEEKDELASIKLELKCWESMFARKYKRKPTKVNCSSYFTFIKNQHCCYLIFNSFIHEMSVDFHF